MITFDGIIFSSGNSQGGVSVYFRELLRHAALGGTDMQVLVHDAKIQAADLNCSPRQIVFRAPRWFERARSLSGLPGGLLHSSYYRTSRQRDVRNVVTVYDFTYEKFSKGLRALFHTRQKIDALKRAAAAICISENTRRDLMEFMPDYPAERIFVTHLAAGEEFRPLKYVEVTCSEQPFVLFVGGRMGYKNFTAAVRAVELAREFALVCVGGGPFSSEEQALLGEALPGRHFHAGPVKTESLNELYNAAVCLMYPSLYEGFGIPPLEAMQAGCPFVALNRSSIPEVAGGAGILSDDSDPQRLAAAIAECATPSRRAELRTRGLEQAAKFSWGRTFTETLSVYRQVLARTST